MCIIDPLKHYVNCKSIIRYLYRYWIILFYCLLVVACQSYTPSTNPSVQIGNSPTPSREPTDPNAPPPVPTPGLLANQFSRPEVRIVQITQSKEQFVNSFIIEADNSIDNKVKVLDYINNDELGNEIVAGTEIMIPPPDFCKVELSQNCQISVDLRLSQEQLLLVTTHESSLEAIANKLHVSQETLIEYNPSLAGQEIVSAYTVFQVPGTITRTSADK